MQRTAILLMIALQLPPTHPVRAQAVERLAERLAERFQERRVRDEGDELALPDA
jgi:hypothetical protein